MAPSGTTWYRLKGPDSPSQGGAHRFESGYGVRGLSDGDPLIAGTEDAEL
jgi:hypothetical protein